MLQYLIILLDDATTSFCHYDVPATASRLMPLETLKKGIFWAMKENMNVQFVFPSHSLPAEYAEVIESIDHSKIKPADCAIEADVVVIESLEELQELDADAASKAFVLRISRTDFFSHYEEVAHVLRKVARLNVVFTDVPTWTDSDMETYKNVLEKLNAQVEALYVEGLSPQLNLLTDRMMLDVMNNCGAGDTALTLAPDGKFYVCPAFYHTSDGYSVGSLEEGLNVKNAQLYRLDHAPLCRHCDAYQCKRCTWLNRRTTLEVNTPSHEQCVVAHLERNASRALQLNLRKHGAFLPERDEIPEITYLDPFDVRKEW